VALLALLVVLLFVLGYFLCLGFEAALVLEDEEKAATANLERAKGGSSATTGYDCILPGRVYSPMGLNHFY